MATNEVAVNRARRANQTGGLGTRFDPRHGFVNNSATVASRFVPRGCLCAGAGSPRGGRAPETASGALFTRTDHPMGRSWIVAAQVMLVAMGYAVLRYVLLGGVSADRLPVFITNKAVAVVGLVLLGAASLITGAQRAAFGAVGFGCVLLHLLLSLTVLSPAYLAKLYAADGRLTAAAEWSMLAGAVATLVLYMLSTAPAKPTGARSLRPGAGQLVLALTAVHVLAIGYPSWSQPDTWPGHLPPITLLSFLIAVGLLAARRVISR